MTQEVRTPLDFKTPFLLNGQPGTTDQVPTKQSDGSLAWQTPAGGGGGGPSAGANLYLNANFV